jgi:8-oxo-dGTP pyrophosphatase MutT (NUDIX family)
MPISSYLAGIRSRIGTDLLLTPAAGIALFDADGRLLLARHVDDGHWGTPGGGVEPGEAPRAAARREFEEELGLRVEDCELIDAYGGPEFVVRYSNGDVTAYVTILYGARKASGEMTLEADELHEVRWFSESEALALDLPPDMRLMVPDAFRWERRRVPGHSP